MSQIKEPKLSYACSVNYLRIKHGSVIVLLYLRDLQDAS